MKYAILSVSDNARRILRKIQCCDGESVEAFIVEQQENWGKKCCNICIISTGKALNYYNMGKFDKFLIPSLSEDINERMYKFLRDMNVSDGDILYADRECIYSLDVCMKFTTYANRKELDTIEFHVADGCNLKCRYCTMFSPLADESTFPDYNHYQRDILQLKVYFRSIKRIKLLGGEPFLNPNLGNYIVATRKAFPYTDICVITNGLKLLEMNDELIDILKKSCTELVISYYPAMGERIEEIHYFLEEQGIRHRITSLVTFFYKIYDLSGKQDRLKNFDICNCKVGCATLRDGYLYTCFVPSVIGIAGNALGLSIDVDDGLDIYKPELCADKIRKWFLFAPQSCKYCLPRGVSVKWEAIGKRDVRKFENWST